MAQCIFWAVCGQEIDIAAKASLREAAGLGREDVALDVGEARAQRGEGVFHIAADPILGPQIAHSAANEGVPALNRH